MTIRNLDTVFAPRSLAVIGASDREGSVGRTLFANIISGGFEGMVWPVNPKRASIDGHRCYRSVAELPGVPDLAVIATPAHTGPELITQLGEKGTRAAVVLSAGLTEANGLRRQMLEAARPFTLRIIGPNTIGLIVPPAKLNASFAHLMPAAGKLALLSQSGAIATTLIDWAQDRGIGFSHIVSLGDMADVDVGDCLDMLARDGNVNAVLMYLETVSDARKFMSAARAISRIKPVVAVKSGRFAISAQAAATHTGALAGADAVFAAALERAGIVRVDTLEELFAAAQVLTRYKPPRETRLCIVTNGGGAGVLALDTLVHRNGTPAELSDDTIARLDASLPATWSRANPVDIIGDAPPERYRAAIEGTAADDGVDIVLAMNCPTALASPLAAAEAVAGLSRVGLVNGKPLMACWLGDHAATPARAVLNAAGIANFETPAQAVMAVDYLADRAKVQALTMRVPSADSGPMAADREGLARIVADARAEGRRVLTEDEGKAFLAAYGMTIPKAAFAADPQAVEGEAETLLATASRLVVKLVSRSHSHKSDVGGVVIGLETARAAREAAEQIASRYRAATGGEPDGFSVQEMIERPHAREVLLGASRDPLFGMTILFGAGGVSAETVADTAIGLPPLDDGLARDMVARTRIDKLLGAYRNVPEVDRTALGAVIISVSDMVVDFPEIEALDINPLLASPDGVVALDARIVLADPADMTFRDRKRLALRPYPTGWATTVQAGGRSYSIQPIRPTDARLFPDFMAAVSPGDVRLRFNVAMSELPHDMLVRLTQIDYDREIAFLAVDAETGAMAGVSRLIADPDHEEAEYAIFVRSDLQGIGLGWALMERLLAYAAKDGLKRVFGEIYVANVKMLDMCRQLGFSIRPHPHDSRARLAVLDLQA